MCASSSRVSGTPLIGQPPTTICQAITSACSAYRVSAIDPALTSGEIARPAKSASCRHPASTAIATPSEPTSSNEEPLCAMDDSRNSGCSTGTVPSSIMSGSGPTSSADAV